jgi:hypothetical protein
LWLIFYVRRIKEYVKKKLPQCGSKTNVDDFHPIVDIRVFGGRPLRTHVEYYLTK